MAVTTDYHFAPVPEALIYDGHLSGTDVRIYAALMRHGLTADSCYPSATRLSRLCHASASTVRRSLTTLAEAGWITVVARFDDEGAQTSNGYHVHGTPTHSCVPPLVTSDQGPYSPVSNEREPLKESKGTNTLTLLSDSTAVVDETPSAKSLDEDFEVWWQEWPKGRRVKKVEARREYHRARKKVSAETLLDGCKAFARLMRQQNVEPRYIVHPSRWLKNERWDDDELTAPPPSPFEGPAMRFG